MKDRTASEATGSKSVIGVKRKQALNIESRKMQESVGSKLHDALAKVTKSGLILSLHDINELQIGPVINLVFLMQDILVRC